MGWWEDHLAELSPERRAQVLEDVAWEEELLARIDEGLRMAVAAALDRHGIYGIEEFMRVRIYEIAREIDPALIARHEASQDAARAKRKKKIPNSLRTEVFERDEYRCRQCGTHRDLRADHITPESAGGPTTLENLQTLCARCNSIKGTKTE